MTTPKIKIRPYKASDVPEIMALWHLVFGPGSAWNQADDVIARKAQQQPDLFFVATQNDVVIGTVMAGYDGVRGWVHRLAVHPDQRRTGIGFQLMRQAEVALGDLGCPKLNLQVRATNADVVAFYQALGYQIEDRISLGKTLA